MSTLTADDALRMQLGKLTELTEIRDAGGQLIGYYTPASRGHSAAYAEAASNIDPQEMLRRKASGKGGYTTKQVLDHLKTLEKA